MDNTATQPPAGNGGPTARLRGHPTATACQGRRRRLGRGWLGTLTAPPTLFYGPSCSRPGRAAAGRLPTRPARAAAGPPPLLLATQPAC